MTPAWHQPWPGRPGRARPERLEARGAAWRGALDAQLRGLPPGGGAAIYWPPEQGRRRTAAAADAGERRGDGPEGERDRRLALAEQKLTSNAGEVMARRTEAGRRRNRRRGGRRWRSEMAMAAAIHDDSGRFLLQGWRARRGASNGAGGGRRRL
jgi:hypothetical protein